MRYLITGGLYLSRLTAAEKKILREAGIMTRTRTWLDQAVENLKKLKRRAHGKGKKQHPA